MALWVFQELGLTQQSSVTDQLELRQADFLCCNDGIAMDGDRVLDVARVSAGIGDHYGNIA